MIFLIGYLSTWTSIVVSSMSTTLSTYTGSSKNCISYCKTNDHSYALIYTLEFYYYYHYIINVLMYFF